MRLSNHSDYALRVLIYLGSLPDAHPPVRLQDIADAYDISANHVAKVVQRLAHLDVIEATRGRGGGILLKKAPEDINVGYVFRVMEPSFTLVPCFSGGDGCKISQCCGLQHILSKAKQAFLQTLDEYTVADAIESPAVTANLLGIEIA
mgnify:CR=1 FL=1